jgi:hypothetical protein
VFPQGEMPAPIPLFKGTQVAGTPVTPAEFAKRLRRLSADRVRGACRGRPAPSSTRKARSTSTAAAAFRMGCSAPGWLWLA